MSQTGVIVIAVANGATGRGGGAFFMFQLWTTFLLMLTSTLLPNSATVSGQGLTHAELTEPVGLQAKKDIADMFNTNPNRLYDDFDGNTIYHKFHPVDDYVPPLPLAAPPNVTIGPDGNTVDSQTNYRQSLAEDSDGYDSNPLLRKPSGPIAYHFDIIPSRPKPPRTPPTPITISSSSSPEPENDIIVKRQAPAPPPSSASSQPPANTRFELYRPQANGDARNLPSFQTLQPDRSASFIPLRVTPGSNMGQANRDPYVSYGVFTNNPNMNMGSGAPIFVPVSNNNNNAAARQWVPPTPMYAPPPNSPPPQQFQFNNQMRGGSGPINGEVAGGMLQANRRNNFIPSSGSGSGFNPSMTFEPRPQLVGRQLRFPAPLPNGYNNEVVPLPPPPAYSAVRRPLNNNAGFGQRSDSLFFPRSGVASEQIRPPPPPYNGGGNRGSAQGPTLTSLLGSPPLTSMNPNQYRALPPSNQFLNQIQPPPNWRATIGVSDVRQMQPPPRYDSSVRPYSSFPSNSNRPYYNLSPPMGQFLPSQNPGAYYGGRWQSPAAFPFIKTESQEPGWQWPGPGYGYPTFDDGKRSRTTPYYVPRPGPGYYAPLSPPGTGSFPGPRYANEQSINAGLQPAAYRRPYWNYAGENRLASRPSANPPGPNQSNQFSNVQPAAVQPAPGPGLGSPNANSNAGPQPLPANNANINTNANVGNGLFGSAFNNSGPGVSNPTGLRAEQRLVEAERASLNPQSSKVPDLSVNRGPVPFYSQADVDGHYRRMLAHNETAADTEFENDPRVLQWYLQRAQQVLQERRATAPAQGTGGGPGGSGSSSNVNNNSNNAGSSNGPNVPVFPIPIPATNAAGATTNENAANANQQRPSAAGAGGGQGDFAARLTLAELLSTSTVPPTQFTRK